VMRKSKHNGDGSFTPDEVLRVVKAFGGEQQRIANPKKLVVGIIIGIIIYAAVLTGLVVWATGLAQDYSIQADGSMMNGGRSVTTGLTMKKKDLVGLVQGGEQDLISVVGIEINQGGDKGWSHFKVASVSKDTGAQVSFATQGGQTIKVAADKSVYLDNKLLSNTTKVSAVLASITILT